MNNPVTVEGYNYIFPSGDGTIVIENKTQSIANKSNGYVFIAAEDSGVYRSTNSGQDWTQINNGLSYIFVMSLVVAKNGDLFAGTVGVYRSTNDGDNWIQNGTIGTGIMCFLLKPNGLILVGTGGGIYRSTDDGATWTFASNGFPNPSAIDVWALVSNNNGDVFAGTGSEGIFRSTDNGDNWIEINNGLPNNADVRTVLVNKAGDVFAGTGSYGVYCSTDNGDTWFSSGISGMRVMSLITNSSEDIFAGTYGAGVYVSKDNGTNWIEINSGLTNWSVRCLTIDSYGYVYIGTDRGGVFRSIQSTTDVLDPNENTPLSYFLKQNFPNPFNSTSVIKYSIPKSSQVSLKIFNTLGQELETLVNEEKPIGTYELNWNAANLPSGVYFYRLQAGSFVQTRKMILLK